MVSFGIGDAWVLIVTLGFLLISDTWVLIVTLGSAMLDFLLIGNDFFSSATLGFLS